MSNQNFDCCHLKFVLFSVNYFKFVIFYIKFFVIIILNFLHSDECLNTDRKTVKFFEITGRTFVYPITYHMYEFQKKIIITAIFNNTLISVPSGKY